MKRLTIIALVCINVVLLAGVLHANLSEVWGQTVRGGNDYLLIIGKGERGDSVYVIDLKTRLMATWSFDEKTDRLTQTRGRNLITDFKKGR